jgi:putative transposase
MMLTRNMLLQWVGKDLQVHVERILFIGRPEEMGNSYNAQSVAVVTIDVDIARITGQNRSAPEKVVSPMRRSLAEIENDIEKGDARLLEDDPFAKFQRREEDIDEGHKTRRDRAWACIEPIVDGTDGEVLDPQERARRIAEAQKRTGYTNKTINKWLRRYFQGGQTPNALLPYFDNCGSKGQDRTGEGRKPGRKTTLWRLTHASDIALAKREGKSLEPIYEENTGNGLALTEQQRGWLLKGVKKFYLDKNKAIKIEEKKVTLKEALQYTIQTFFNLGYDENGKPVLPPPDETPSLGQFYHEYTKLKESDPNLVYIARHGVRAFKLLRRATTGNSTHMALGPGWVYQIDATIGDIYLVSPFDRTRIIGKPVIYLVQDVFTRLIVGVAVLFEGPNWLGGQMALANALTDKVAFCAEYGVHITDYMWPSKYAPAVVLADGGEFKGISADQFPRSSIGSRFDIVPAFRPDWKPIIEQNFKVVKGEIPKWVPGLYFKEKARGGHDYRLDARLTPYAFMRMLIYLIIKHNNHRDVSSLRIMDRDMIQAHVPPYSVDIWHWGVAKLLGKLKHVPQDIVRLNLLDSDVASITPSGIWWRGQNYTCQLAEDEQWFEQARDGRKKLDVALDRRTNNRLYLRLDNGRRCEECMPIEEWAIRNLPPEVRSDESYDIRHPFRNCGYYEMEDYLAHETASRQLRAPDHRQAQLEYNMDLTALVKQETEATEKALGASDLTKTERLQGIRTNRKEVADAERRSGAWNLPSSNDNTPTVEQLLLSQAQTDDVDQGSQMAAWRDKNSDMLREIQERALRPQEDDV